MSNKSTKNETTHVANSQVQKIKEWYELLITSHQQKQQVQQPPQPDHVYHNNESDAVCSEQQNMDDAETIRDLEIRRGIRRSQAFRRSTLQSASKDHENSTSVTASMRLIHTESIREALSKPLPKGPPPEKPPRSWECETVNAFLNLVDEHVAETQHYEEVRKIIDAAFQEPEKGLYEPTTPEQILLKEPLSEKHRKRLLRFSQCGEQNKYSQEYGTIRGYKAVDQENAPPKAKLQSSFTKELIDDYNKLCIGEGGSKTGNSHTLYEYCVVVGYDLMQNNPYIKSKYPMHKQPHKKLEKFVYPDSGALVRNCDQEYCIILTDYPLRFYCFCRRVLPESFEFCIPLTYCLVTKHNEPKVFYKLLECIESQHGNGQVPEQLIERFHKQKLPLAGETLNLMMPTNFSSQKMLQADNQLQKIMTINRPKDIRLEKTELYDIYNCLGYDGLIHVFENLLLEKTVILFSEHISLLTSCIQGLLLILYPFQWHHIIVSVVPDDLQQMLDAPVPMLAGTLQPVSENIWQNGETCYVNLDKRIVLSMRREQVSVLPSELMNPLRVSLNLVKIFDDSKGLASVLIGDVFIRFFVELFSCLEPSTYKKSLFVESFENQETKLFLDCFLETLMFKDFLEHWKLKKITSPASNSIDYTLFNSKIAEKSQNRYWHSAVFEEIVANSRQAARKEKTFISKMREKMKKW